MGAVRGREAPPADAFEIRIRERIPAFWMLKDGVLYYADNRGQIIAPVNVGNFLVAADAGDPARRRGTASPDGRAFPRVSGRAPACEHGQRFPVSVSAAKGFEVFIENRNLVLCIAAEDWDANLRRLSLVLSDSGPPRRVEDGTGSLGRRRQRLGCRT